MHVTRTGIVLQGMENRLGVYIHIPFCASKCAYCDFCSVAGADELMPEYQEALLEHISESSQQLSSGYVDTIYFGGGTPSYYGGAKYIREILDELKRTAQVLKESEISIEANPDSIEIKALTALRREGVNRISIGVQSANDGILRLMGRRHSFRQAQDAVNIAREAGFDNISIDLMFGLPSQTRKEWAETLSRALEMRPEHISCYGLKLEEATPMYAQFHGTPFLPDEDEQADMYLYAVETLVSYGYPQYEVSNFAVPGYECRHNLKYWTMDEYIGFGASASSNVGNLRYGYVADIEEYITGVLDNGILVAETEDLTISDRASEYIMLGLRTAAGISSEEYHSKYHSNFNALEVVFRDYEKKGWAQFRENRWAFTPTGFLLSNTLINTLLETRRKQGTAGETLDDIKPKNKLLLRDFN